jgi:hypothetical protein
MNTLSPSAAAQASPALPGNYVLLRADALQLLLPQHEIGAVWYLTEAPQASATPGVFSQDGRSGERRLLALSAQMQPLVRYPEERYLVTTIATPQGEVDFAWDEMSVLTDPQLRPQPIPAALLLAHSPLQEFVEIGDRTAFCCDATRLADHVLPAKG